MTGRIDFVLPGLFNLPLEELDTEFLKTALPALNQVLSCARLIPNELFDFDQIIASVLGLTAQSGLPMAQAWAGPGTTNTQRLMLFRAVHLKPDRYSALVFPVSPSRESFDDLDIIINDLKDLFKEDCDIRKLFDGTYLMRLNDYDPPTHYPHHLSIIGKKANQFIEQSREVLPWYQLINEMQMFMHQHAVNADRLKTGLLPINSLWCWGAGSKPQPYKPRLDCYTDDRLIRQFASSLGITDVGTSQFEQGEIERDILIVELKLLESLKFFQNQPIQPLLSALEEELFKPLLRTVRSKRCVLQLRTGHGMDFRYSSYSSLKFWRAPKSLLDFRPF